MATCMATTRLAAASLTRLALAAACLRSVHLVSKLCLSFGRILIIYRLYIIGLGWAANHLRIHSRIWDSGWILEDSSIFP